MKLVRFIAKAIHGDMLMQPGDEKLVEDSYGGPHVVDVATGQTSVATPPPQAVFRADLAQRPPGSGMIVGPSTETEARVFGKQFGGVIESVMAHLWTEVDRLRAELAKALGSQPAAAAVAPVSGAEGIPAGHLAEIEAAGRRDRLAGGPGESPSGLDPAEVIAWRRGWDAADHDANTAARAGASGPVAGDDQTRIAAGFGNVYGSGTTGDQRGASAQPSDAALHDDGCEARRAGRPRIPPDDWRSNALSDDDKAKWLAGWDEASPSG